jgi:hypothetical protein
MVWEAFCLSFPFACAASFRLVIVLLRHPALLCAVSSPLVLVDCFVLRLSCLVIVFSCFSFVPFLHVCLLSGCVVSYVVSFL